MLLFQVLLKITYVRLKEKSDLDENMSITAPVFFFCCECCSSLCSDKISFAVTPSPELHTFSSTAIKHTIWQQNLVSYLAAEGIPLSHVHLGWFPVLSGREKGQAEGLGTARAEEELNTATLCIYLFHYFSQTSLHGWGCCSIWGPCIFLPDCKFCRHPRSPHLKGPRRHVQLQPPTSSNVYLVSVCPIGRSPSLHHPSCCFLILLLPTHLVHKPLHQQYF